MAQAVRNYSEKSSRLKSDLAKYIEQSPSSVTAVLFMANHTPEVVSAEQDTVGSIEDESLSLEYADPVPAVIKFVPPDSPIRHQMSYDAETLIEAPGGDDILMLISVPNVTNESIVQYEEYDSEFENGEGEMEIISRTVTLIVKHSQAILRAPVAGLVYFAIPMTDTEGLIDES